MGQASKYFRRATDGHLMHWCPGCEEMHKIWISGPTRWEFNGDLHDKPTFNPSVRVSWNGRRAGVDVHEVCHYFLHDGVLKFCSDSTHGLAGKNVPLPELPPEMKDYGGTTDAY